MLEISVAIWAISGFGWWVVLYLAKSERQRHDSLFNHYRQLSLDYQKILVAIIKADVPEISDAVAKLYVDEKDKGKV